MAQSRTTQSQTRSAVAGCTVLTTFKEGRAGIRLKAQTTGEMARCLRPRVERRGEGIWLIPTSSPGPARSPQHGRNLLTTKCQDLHQQSPSHATSSHATCSRAIAVSPTSLLSPSAPCPSASHHESPLTTCGAICPFLTTLHQNALQCNADPLCGASAFHPSTASSPAHLFSLHHHQGLPLRRQTVVGAKYECPLDRFRSCWFRHADHTRTVRRCLDVGLAHFGLEERNQESERVGRDER
jgi:hypothetical protein